MNLLKLFSNNKDLEVKVTTREINVKNAAHSTYNRGFAPLILEVQAHSGDDNKNKELVEMR